MSAELIAINTAMKTSLIAALLALIAGQALAQNQFRDIELPAKCASRDLFLNRLINEYGEQPVWIGQRPNSKVETALLVNPKTGTWTVIIFQDSIICAVSDGEGFRLPAQKNPAIGSKVIQ